MKTFFFLLVGFVVSMSGCLAADVHNDDSKIFYYYSEFYCPKERPIRKVEFGDSSSCFYLLYGVNEDYFEWAGKKICKIPFTQQEEQKQINKKIKQKENAISNDVKTKMRVEKLLLGRESDWCFSQLSIHTHYTIDFEPHEGECTEKELNQLRKENKIKEEYNALQEKKLMAFYGQDCFSCDDELDFWTDEKTCSLCPNREMVGSLCVLKNTDNKGSLF